MRLVLGSAFTGAGLLDLGVEWALADAGIDHVVGWMCEKDGFARAILRDRFPEVPRVYEDVTSMQGAEVEPVDVLVAGVPCQGASVAGKRPSDPLASETTGLWRHVARLLDEASPAPRYFVLENVDRLASRGLDVVVGDLERLGYVVYGRILSASDVGAPHRRRRLFLVCERDESPLLLMADAARERRAGRREASGRRLADAARERQERPARKHEAKRRSGPERGREALAEPGDDGRPRQPPRDGAERGLDEQGGRHADRRRLEEGGGVLADPVCAGRQGTVPKPSGRRAGPPGRGGAGDVADADREPLRDAEQRRSGRRPDAVRDQGGSEPGDDERARGRTALAGLGGDPHGGSDGLDERTGGDLLRDLYARLGPRQARAELRRLVRWPAGRGAEQHPWEPSCTVAPGRDRTRRPRLRVLGNAVVAEQARRGPGAMLVQMILAHLEQIEREREKKEKTSCRSA